MLSRILPTIAALLLATTAPAQAPDRADLERRLGELEKQLTTLLTEVKALRQELRAAAPASIPAGAETKIFTLRYAVATDMVRVLNQLFGAPDGRALVLVADPRTNSVILRGRADLMSVIEAVVARLDQASAPGKGGGPVKHVSRELLDRRADLQVWVAQAEIDVVLRQDRVAWSERMVKLGYLTESQVQAERAELHNAQVFLSKAQAELKSLPADPQKPSK